MSFDEGCFPAVLTPPQVTVLGNKGPKQRAKHSRPSSISGPSSPARGSDPQTPIPATGERAVRVGMRRPDCGFPRGLSPPAALHLRKGTEILPTAPSMAWHGRVTEQLLQGSEPVFSALRVSSVCCTAPSTLPHAGTHACTRTRAFPHVHGALTLAHPRVQVSAPCTCLATAPQHRQPGYSREVARTWGEGGTVGRGRGLRAACLLQLSLPSWSSF